MKTKKYHKFATWGYNRNALFSRSKAALRTVSMAAGTGLLFTQNTAFAAELIFTQLYPDVPLMGVGVENDSKPAFVDIDNDGEYDVFIGRGNGTIDFYKNVGTNSKSVFTVQSGAANPFDLVDVGNNSSPAFVDIDDDGDYDAFIGVEDGTVQFYRNDGSNSNPTFVEQIGGGNPLDGVDPGSDVAPVFVDIDNDNDHDVFIGEKQGIILFYKNTGSNINPVFVNQIGADNPLNGVDVGRYSVPAFVDIDNDMDSDIFIGDEKNGVYYYKNTGTREAPVFTAQVGAANPLADVDVGDRSAPTFVDIDNDGDFDSVIGVESGELNIYNNTGSANSPVIALWRDPDFPFTYVRVGGWSAPDFADIDGDDDLDLFIGQNDGAVSYFKNIGTQITPDYIRQTGAANPLDGVDVGDFSAPALADIDNDGDLDLLIGDREGRLRYFLNDGSVLAPIFTEQLGGDNPLNGEDVGGVSSPTFTDIDGDGDFDLFVGAYEGAGSGVIKYYKNTGSKNNPVFTKTAGEADPLDGVNVLFAASIATAPSFADIDGDGDLDLVIGEYFGGLHYFENNGSRTSPLFAELTGADNPLTGKLSGGTHLLARPTFADIDDDGDPDLFVGENTDVINYFRNDSTNFSWTMFIPAFTHKK